MNRIAVYPGSFDPMTNGHLNLIKRSLKLCDKLIVSVGNNSNKNYFFSTEERVNLIKETLEEELLTEQKNKVEVLACPGLLIDFVKEKQAKIIIRGIRALSDFDYEFNLAGANYKLNPDIETIFLPAGEKYQFVSSKVVKEIIMFKGDVASFVPKNIVVNINKKLLKF